MKFSISSVNLKLSDFSANVSSSHVVSFHSQIISRNLGDYIRGGSSEPESEAPTSFKSLSFFEAEGQVNQEPACAFQILGCPRTS